MGCPPGQPSYRTFNRKPSLAKAFRKTPCRQPEQFWCEGKETHTSSAFGLVGGRLRPARMEIQATPQADHAFRNLPPRDATPGIPKTP